MAKVKIINSYSLECLTSNLHSQIEQTDSQIVVYEDELENEKKHRQNEKTIDRIRNQRHDCLLQRDVLHQCLCNIVSHTKEIEI